METFHEYLRLILGLIVTVIIGAWLAEQYRAKSAEYDTAEQVFQSQSELLGERISSMSDVIVALKEKQAPDEAISVYRKFLGGYNAKRNYNRALIELYYGERIYNEERDLHYQLRHIGQELECAYKTKKPVDATALNDEINQSWERLSDLSKHMGSALRDDKIGRNRAIDTVEPNKVDTSFSCDPPKA